MYVCMYVCVYVYMYVNKYMYTCMYVRTDVRMYVCMYICMCLYIYVCMYVCIYICRCSNTIPSLWKKSFIYPVPKRPNPVELNDFRPVALTPVIMKCFERIMLHHLLKQTEGKLDPLQFAYKRNRGVCHSITSS